MPDPAQASANPVPPRFALEKVLPSSAANAAPTSETKATIPASVSPASSPSTSATRICGSIEGGLAGHEGGVPSMRAHVDAGLIKMGVKCAAYFVDPDKKALVDLEGTETRRIGRSRVSGKK